MAKYDQELTELKNLLPVAKNILIALPKDSDIDKLAAGLALFLSLEQTGKEVAVVCEDTIKVSQAYLFGVDHLQKTLPQTEGGNLTLTLEGVVAPDGTVPALENLDWYPQGNNLNLVFHVLPGQTFQPSRIMPHYQGSGFNLIFVVGAANLNSLGGIYSQNQNIFSGVHLVNIDIQAQNTGFGVTNVVDTQASSISEVVTDLAASLNLPLDQDIASNLLAGVFAATNNLTKQNLNADTFLAVATNLRAGGKRPQAVPPQASPGLDLSALMPKEPSFTTPRVLNQPSPEERPTSEGLASADSIEPEPGWLTPKIFKGTSTS